MIDWVTTIVIAGILAGGLWLLLRIYLPLQALSRLVQRVRDGERVHAWEVNGPLAIRKAAKALADLSEEYSSLQNSQDASQSELNSILSSIEEGVIIVGIDGLIKLSNRNFNRFFMIKEELEGRRLRDLVQVFDVNDVIEQAGKSGESQERFISFQLLHDDKFVTRSYRLFGSPMKNAQGKVIGCLLVVADYSKIKEMESVERQMVASVSHELRTPLAVFKGYLEALIDMEADGDDETRRILAVLSRHSNRLNQLVEDLLILSRVEERALAPIFEPVKVAGFLQRVKEDSGHFLNKEIKLKIAIDDDIEIVYMDAFRIEQVFHNLIDNAQRHSEGSKQIRIGVKRDRASQTFHFYVEDHGMGIPSDKLPLIFNRFYRVDRARSRARGGTGLGLTIVREIVRAHGGDAWAESNLGEGTIIWFSLPDRSEEDD